jgi:hypothetical protein
MKILEEIYKQLSSHDDETAAYAYGITIGTDGLKIKVIGKNADIYDLIENLSDMELADSFNYLGVITYGWAAPLNNDGGMNGAPSEHKDRRRVKLISAISYDESEIIGSVMYFKDNDEVIYDYNTATGSLAYALEGLVR